MTPNDQRTPGVCQHDLLKPDCTVTVRDNDPYTGSCWVCRRTWSTRHIILDQVVEDRFTGQQPAQPGSGEVKRYTPNSIANEIMAEDAWHDSQWVRAADYDRLQSALAAAQQRIAALHASLRTYGYHKPECDYMQEELPCTCGLLDAIKEPT